MSKNPSEPDPSKTLAGLRPTQTGGPTIGKKAFIALSSFALTLMIVELIIRVRIHSANSETLQNALAQVVEPSQAADAGLGNLVRLAENEKIVYELQPGLVQRTFRDSLVSTDELGFRISPPVPQDDRPLFTIVGIGDSIQFGHGVNDSEPYLYRLQELLTDKYPAKRWRVVNAGVPGYNTVMEVETLRTKCLALEPDLVILSIVSNDYAPPFFVRTEEDPWRLDRVFLLEALRDKLGKEKAVETVESDTDTGGELLSAGRNLYERDEDDKAIVPEGYQGIFGPVAFKRALDELRSLSEEHRFEVLCFSTYEWGKTGPMLKSARERGFPHSTLMPELRAYLKQQKKKFSAATYRTSELVVSQRNPHPSPLQHDMAARRLLADLEKLGLLGLEDPK